DHEVTRLDRAALDDRVVRDTVRLGDRRRVEADVVGDAVQDARLGEDDVAERAVGHRAVTHAVRAQVVAAGPAQRALPADRRGRLAHDAVAHGPAGDALTDLDDHTAHLVTE